jgi:homoserine trans-succinylase
MYYLYDMDGCAYASSINITTKSMPIKRYRVFIGTADTPYEANMIASKYVYDVQRSIDISADREYYIDEDEDGEEYINYPSFDKEKDYIDFINEFGNDDDEF